MKIAATKIVIAFKATLNGLKRSPVTMKTKEITTSGYLYLAAT
jgi:hypothetical protein